MPEVTVTVVLLQSSGGGAFSQQEIKGVIVNTQAPNGLILQGILQGLKARFNISLDANQVDMYIQGPSGSSLDNYLQDGSKIIVMPRYIAPPVVFPNS